MATFNAYKAALKQGTKVLAREMFDDYQEAASADAQSFVDALEEDLKRWTKLVADKRINEEDFSDLLQAKKALAQMFALRQKGLALSRIETFRKGLINLAVDTAFDVFL